MLLFENKQVEVETLCQFTTGTVEFILCEEGGKIVNRHVQAVLANGAKCRVEDFWLMSEDNLNIHIHNIGFQE